MLRTATRADLPLIRDIFARGNDVPYDLAVVAEEKAFGAGFREAPRVRICDEHGVAVTCGDVLRVLAVDRGHRGRGIGTALLEDSKATTIAAEPGNYFVAGAANYDMVNWLTNRGYTLKSRTNDLWIEGLDAFEMPANVKRGSERTLDWIEHHFGAIWRFEAARALEADPPTLFIIEYGGYLAGFAAHEANNRGLGTFGPTGVASEFRGRGLGKALLHASLADLRRLGYGRAIIPWTGAVDFYRKSAGARVGLDLAVMVASR